MYVPTPSQRSRPLRCLRSTTNTTYTTHYSLPAADAVHGLLWPILRLADGQRRAQVMGSQCLMLLVSAGAVARDRLDLGTASSKALSSTRRIQTGWPCLLLPYLTCLLLSSTFLLGPVALLLYAVPDVAASLQREDMLRFFRLCCC